MATLGATNLTLLDYAKRLGSDNKIAKIIELLNDTNDIIPDMVIVEANGTTGHRTTVRSGLPSVTWRLLNYGVQPSKSRTVQVTDTFGMLEGYSEIDKALADLNGNTPEFRLSEDRAFIEAMNQEMAETLFYGNTSTAQEEFMGLAPRYNSTTAENGGNIITGGGSGSDNTSVWLVVWGENTCHCIYPKGSKAGFTHEDKGQVTLEDADGGKYEGYRSHYKWDLGLTLRDWRYVVRIANIDRSDLTATGASGAKLIELMIKAIHKIPNIRLGKAAFYANNDVITFLDLQTLNQSNVNVSYGQDVHGQKVMTFRGIPVRRCDAILNTEATVS